MKTKLSKIVISLLLVCVLCVGAFALVACDGETLQAKINGLQDKVNGYEETNAEKSIVIYIGDEKFETTTRQNKMYHVLLELLEANKITKFASSGGEYGAFITSLHTLSPASGQYFAVYHTIDKVEFKGSDWTTGALTIKHADIDFFYSNVGVSSLPILNGANYWFTVA